MQQQLDAIVKHMSRSGILYRQAVGEFQRAFISSALRDCKGNISKAAPKLGLHRNTLSRAVAHLGLDLGALRASGRRPPGSVSPGYRAKASG
jgi:Fis family transcriptional regulator, factor for inversion stimulation protein